MIADGWKLIRNGGRDDRPELELFDHGSDPLNHDNVADANQDVVERLAGLLERWLEDTRSKRLASDGEATEGLSPQELERLRSLGYIQ